MSSQIRTAEDNLVPGDIIVTKCHTYEVQSFLGEGSFGKVVKCVRSKDDKTVAVKVLKKEGRYHDQAKSELNALLKIKDLDLDKCSLVQNYSSFVHKGFYCLVFEYLEQTLSAFMIARSYQPLPLKSIRLIVQQLATALQTLRSIGLMHTDIKMDNVMLVNHRLQPFKVKLIDFGLARSVSAVVKGVTIQPLCCRSPEVFLGLPLTEAIDMWSLGCLCARLYLGVRLYYGKNEYEMESFGLQPEPVHQYDVGW
ncbi:Homeodomain-interacting protein kinase 2 [Takifugu flavidus]|uniref:Homeodomain-interacting protein kinase 2 n=1 Tax=Takifugu flavidus TaxID=433684 RepID=A0A5C6N2X1_9TELE|nr:Homeodomain-interacting protein kinase 2 [Takifugu flavidus]